MSDTLDAPCIHGRGCSESGIIPPLGIPCLYRSCAPRRITSLSPPLSITSSDLRRVPAGGGAIGVNRNRAGAPYEKLTMGQTSPPSLFMQPSSSACAHMPPSASYVQLNQQNIVCTLFPQAVASLEQPLQSSSVFGFRIKSLSLPSRPPKRVQDRLR